MSEINPTISNSTKTSLFLNEGFLEAVCGAVESDKDKLIKAEFLRINYWRDEILYLDHESSKYKSLLWKELVNVVVVCYIAPCSLTKSFQENIIRLFHCKAWKEFVAVVQKAFRDLRSRVESRQSVSMRRRNGAWKCSGLEGETFEPMGPHWVIVQLNLLWD